MAGTRSAPKQSLCDPTKHSRFVHVTFLRGLHVQVDWDLSPREELFLRVMYRADKARKQALHVWRCKRLFGPDSPFTLYGPEGTAELTDRPYILAMQ